MCAPCLCLWLPALHCVVLLCAACSEPRARLLSHMFYIMKLYAAWTRTARASHFIGKDAAYWRQFAPATTDNYATR